VPLPLKDVFCVTPGAVTTTFAVYDAIAVGVNTTLIRQVDPTATEALHVLVCEN
jgi:hypothetical protein